MIQNLEEKVKFFELVDEMKFIERQIILKNGNLEDDAQHSFHLAFMVMIFTPDFPELDIAECFRLALLHDIVEIYAGDDGLTFDEKSKKLKEEKEKLALQKLEETLGKDYFAPYKSLIEEYEQRKSLESEFVHQLDKLQPIFQIVKEGGKSWHKYKIDINKLKELKYKHVDDKFGFKQILDRYFKEAEEKNMYYYSDN